MKGIGEKFVSFLAVADIQYAEYSSRRGRFYGESLGKLRRILDAERCGRFNFLLNLGDITDSSADFIEKPLSELRKFDIPLINVLGNHDTAKSADDGLRAKRLLGLVENPYYFFDVGNWRFIVLDGTRLSPLAECNSPALKKECAKLRAKLKSENDANFMDFNGGIDRVQLKWLIFQLKAAVATKKNTAVFCHFQIYPKTHESLYNYDEIAKILRDWRCVKLYVCGHNHKGGFESADGLHFVTVGGLCEDELTLSYSRFYLGESKIRIDGFGLSRSFELAIRD